MKQALPILTLMEMARSAFAKIHPAVPPHCYPEFKYTDNTTNGLTKCIIDFVRLKGGYSERVNTQGQYNAKIGKFTKGMTRKGTPDIVCSIGGKFVSVEVKVGKDRQSEHQMKIEEEIKRSAGVYFIAKDFASFIEFYNTINK